MFETYRKIPVNAQIFHCFRKINLSAGLSVTDGKIVTKTHSYTSPDVIVNRYSARQTLVGLNKRTIENCRVLTLIRYHHVAGQEDYSSPHGHVDLIDTGEFATTKRFVWLKRSADIKSA